MKILIDEIPDEGLDIEDVEEIAAATGGVARTARLSVRVEKVDSDVLVRGIIEAELSLSCGRCLAGFVSDIKIPVDLEYRPVEELSAEEKNELSPGEMDMGFLSGGELDLGEVSKEQVLLNMPMKPLCSDACKGICPRCGANLNEGPCGCDLRQAGFGFDKLKEYFKGRG